MQRSSVVTPVESGSGINNDRPRWGSVPAGGRRSAVRRSGGKGEAKRGTFRCVALDSAERMRSECLLSCRLND